MKFFIKFISALPPYSAAGVVSMRSCSTRTASLRAFAFARPLILCSKNSARYLQDGVEVNIEGKNLFGAENVRQELVDTVGKLEWYLNRDSVPYREIYNIPEVRTLIRVSWSGNICCVFPKLYRKTKPFSRRNCWSDLEAEDLLCSLLHVYHP